MFKNPKLSSTETSSFNTLYRQLSFQNFFALELHKTSKNCKNAELFFKLPSTQPPFLNIQKRGVVYLVSATPPKRLIGFL